MRKLTIFVLLVAGSLALGGSDAWKTKPYQQWDQNDVKAVLTSSPWVKQTSVSASWKKDATNPPYGQGQPAQPNQPVQQRPGSMGGSSGSATGGSGSMQQSNTQEEPSSLPGGQDTPFLVRWSSSQTVREAVARQAVLNGRSSEAQVQQYVNQEPSVYQVLVYGPDMTPFANQTTDTLKLTAYLEVKPSKEKVGPSTVEILKQGDGKTIDGVLFSFSKQGTNGQPLVGADDKQARFDCKLKEMHIDTQFDLRKMVGKNGRDL